jgi:hypothetical protein
MTMNKRLELNMRKICSMMVIDQVTLLIRIRAQIIILKLAKDLRNLVVQVRAYF